MKATQFTLNIIIILLCFAVSTNVFADEDGQHSDSTAHEQTNQSDTTEEVASHEHADQTDTHTEAEVKENNAFAAFSSFPNLHPLFVHFPVVLLTLAVFSQIAGFFVFKRPLGWVTLMLLIGGFVGGLFAAEVFHPHPGNLPEHVQEIFTRHETLASWTLWLSGIALAIKGTSLAIKQKTWLEIVVLLLLLASGTVVSLTGHLGSQMVFIENVGPQGKYLEEGHHEH